VRISKRRGIACLVVVLLAAALGVLAFKPAQVRQEVAGSIARLAAKAAFATGFGTYREVPVNVKPAIQPYTVKADLSNVTNRDRFKYSPPAKEMLARNGFVVIPGQCAEFFMLYEMNRYDSIPNFITTDAMLHNYHLFFSHLLKSLERERLVPELKKLNAAMFDASLKQYQELRGTSWENAARRNVAFFTVACKLMDMNQQTPVPAGVQEVVDRELALIEKHRGIEVSPVMSMGRSRPDLLEDLKEDYSQYIPRGHYTKTEDLKNYFKAMMWYGRLTFRLKDEDETRSAVLITLALNQGENLKSWERIYEPTNFFVGKSDDINCLQYQDLLKGIYGERISLRKLAGDPEKWAAFLKAAGKLQPPAINSIPIFDETIQPDREREIKGFRFMGQRFTLDASIFQRLVYREVKENSEGERRMLPKGLDVPAAMGSREAYRLLEEMGETGYEKYPENMQKMRDYIAGLDLKTWTQNLYWSWLYTLQPLVWEKPAGYPSFMLNKAWTRKELNTYLGSWTELKHDTILYAKQVYAEMGGAPEEQDDRGYVEPNPYLYGRLASLIGLTRDGLAQRGLLNERDKASLDRMEQLALSLKDISEKELNNLPLTGGDYDLIRTFGGQLEHFWLEALRDEGITHRSALADQPAPVVADVATAPPDLVLEEGTGYVSEIYAVVPVDGRLRIARGGVYSYYEFSWPIDDRLTDARWREMLNTGKAPEPPGWTKDFTGSGTVQPLPAWDCKNG